MQPQAKFLIMMYHARPFTEALRHAPSLRIFRLPRAEVGFMIVEPVSGNPMLQEIRSMQPFIRDHNSARFFEIHGRDNEIRRLLVFPDKSEQIKTKILSVS